MKDVDIWKEQDDEENEIGRKEKEDKRHIRRIDQGNIRKKKL